MPVLRVKNIRAGYEGTEVLKDVSIEIEGGKGIVAVIGANGAGKSTLSKAITGVLPLKSGSIVFQGREISKFSVGDRIRLGISCVPEGRQVFPFMNTLENLKMGAHLIENKELIGRNLERVFSYFPLLKARSKQMAITMSGGEQQMLALGRAFMSNPSLLFMDEPTMGLAPLIVEELSGTITNLNQAEKVETVLLEQNAQLALDIASYVYVMEVGKIALEGASSALRENQKVKEAYLGL